MVSSLRHTVVEPANVLRQDGMINIAGVRYPIPASPTHIPVSTSGSRSRARLRLGQMGTRAMAPDISGFL